MGVVCFVILVGCLVGCCARLDIVVICPCWSICWIMFNTPYSYITAICE